MTLLRLDQFPHCLRACQLLLDSGKLDEPTEKWLLALQEVMGSR